MVIDSTFKGLLDELDQISKDYGHLLQRYTVRGCMFEQCVSYGELLDIKSRLDALIKKARAVEDPECKDVENEAVVIAEAIDKALYIKHYVSEK